MKIASMLYRGVSRRVLFSCKVADKLSRQRNTTLFCMTENRRYFQITDSCCNTQRAAQFARCDLPIKVASMSCYSDRVTCFYIS